MATNRERSFMWILVVFGLFQLYATAANDARLAIVEHLLKGILTRDLVDINDELSNLKLIKAGSNCCDASKPMNREEPRHDLINELAEDVENKLFAMGLAFSAEKKQLRDDKNEMFEFCDGLNMSLNVLRQQLDEIEGRVMRLDELPNEIERNRETMTELDERIQGLTSQVTILGYISKELEHDRERMTEMARRVTELEEQLANQQVNEEEKGRDQFVVTTSSGRDQFVVTTSSGVELMITEGKRCPDGWERQLGSCIWYSEVELNWADAVNNCMAKGGILAEPYTQDAFSIIINNVPGRKDWWRYWIGASDMVEEGVFVWKSTGRPIGEVKWDEGEPNNNNGDEDCVELLGEGHSLNDNDCVKEYKFICEIKL